MALSADWEIRDAKWTPAINIYEVVCLQCGRVQPHRTDKRMMKCLCGNKGDIYAIREKGLKSGF
jgi:hypothetical protein